MKRSYIREILESINEHTISFAGGLPNKNLFPLKQIRQVSLKVLEYPDALQYSQSQGLESLRKEISNIYTNKFNFKTNKDEILITTGSQQAFDIILKTFQTDKMIVQSPSYIGAIGAFRALKLKINSFESINYLKNTLKKSNILYLMSDFQNPNTKSYTKEERMEIEQVLKKQSSILIEDGAYSFLSFDGKISQAISSHYSNSFHLGTFSKIIAPGLRVGWIRAKKENIQKILFAKEALDLHTSTLNQMIIFEYLNTFNLEDHLKLIREDNYKRMIFLSKCFKKFMPYFDFELPKGGMFIYGKFKDIDTMNLAKQIQKLNIAFVPASVFYHDDRVSYEARFNFTNLSYKQMLKGIKKIANFIDKHKYISS